jgi:hypothetical protein
MFVIGFYLRKTQKILQKNENNYFLLDFSIVGLRYFMQFILYIFVFSVGAEAVLKRTIITTKRTIMNSCRIANPTTHNSN